MTATLVELEGMPNPDTTAMVEQLKGQDQMETTIPISWKIAFLTMFVEWELRAK